MKNRWVLRPVDNTAAVRTLQHKLNDLPEALARTLVLRGIETYDQARAFFRPSLAALHDPFLMRDMDAAADRLAQAIQGRERVLVYGDYDVDGTTSTALMTGFLHEQGTEADYFIPNRFTHGYGLNKAGIDQATAWGARLIVALDCGITAIEEAAYARAEGLDLIICDHHTAGDELPDALAVLDPKRPDCPYPFKELSGCGVAFKLVQATLARLGVPSEGALPYLDLVALSTASDIVPLVGENRVLMREGLQQLQQTPRLGLRALAQAARLDFDNVSVDRIVFGVGPRINAAGRMDEASRAVALMLADDESEALVLAKQLERINQERRALDREIQAQALRKAEIQLAGRMRHALVLHEPDWHQGVIGIVASRLVERFYRPAVMLCTSNGFAKGSARSITGINIYDAIKACEDLLVQFGGHDYAAGLTLPEEHIPAFRQHLDAYVKERATPEMLLPIIHVDAVMNLEGLTSRFWSILRQFAPFGPENMRPVFHGRDLVAVGRPRTVGTGGAHLKMQVRQRGDLIHPPHNVIGFSQGKHLQTVLMSQKDGQPLEMLFSIEENTWQGRTSLQLQARDMRVEEGD